MNAEREWHRTNRDKQEAIRAVLENPDVRQLSDTEIARRCGVSNKTVTVWRKKLGLAPVPSPVGADLRRCADGRVMNIGRIGSKARCKSPSPSAPAIQSENEMSEGAESPAVDWTAERTERMTVTPALARLWLCEHNARNRPLREGHWMKIACDILDGRWQFNGETICFDALGQLLDGQHRLMACLEAGRPIETLVVFGVSPEARPTVGIGVAKSVADHAYADGVLNAGRVAALARLVLLHRSHGIQKLEQTHLHPTHTQVYAAVKELPGLQEAAAAAALLAQHGQRLGRPAILGFCYYVFAEQSPELAERFFEELRLGIGGPESVTWLLRERLIANAIAKAKLPDLDILALLFKAWIAFREGRSPRQLKWARGGTLREGFPNIAWEKAQAAQAAR